MTFTTNSGGVTTCNLGGASDLCSSLTSMWPPAGANQVGMTLGVRADYSFNSAMATLARGLSTVGGTVDLPGETSQIIQY
jgi:hypothetical protein